MKGSKIIIVFLWLATALLAVLPCLYHRTWNCPVDLQFRHNESLCAHTGVNPFHVWNRDISSDSFVGLSRHDKPLENAKGKLRVHAYPPWHMTFTWFYGCMPYSYVVGLIFLIYGVMLTLMVQEFSRLSESASGAFYWGWLALGLIPASVSCFVCGNYGIIVAGLLLLLCAAIRRKHDILAGVIWALMMIKPQAATLVFFPLLFQKKYLTIFTAVLVCILATLWPAYVYGESVLSLILQVPEIGAPYDTSVILSKLPHSIYTIAKTSWIVLCVGVCGLLSWRLRNATELVYRFAPAVFIFPLWLYSQYHDQVAVWPFIALTAISLPRMTGGRLDFWLVYVYIVFKIIGSVFAGLWGIGTSCNIFSPTGIGWIYHAVLFPSTTLDIVVGLRVLWKYSEKNLKVS